MAVRNALQRVEKEVPKATLDRAHLLNEALVVLGSTSREDKKPCMNWPNASSTTLASYDLRARKIHRPTSNDHALAASAIQIACPNTPQADHELTEALQRHS